MHKKDELRPADVTLSHGVSRDVEGREVGRRGDVVKHGDLQRHTKSGCGGRHGSASRSDASLINNLQRKLLPIRRL